MADVARFTELLFADQTLDELLVSPDEETFPEEVCGLLARAAEHIRQGEKARAARILLEITANPNMETRMLLWSWAALRRLDVHPQYPDEDVIKGVVIQVPIENGVDVLAAYSDGTARYVNHSGKVIVWDIPDASITSIIYKLLECSKSLRGAVAKASVDHSVSGLVRVTLLTFKGNLFAEASMQSIASSPINQVLAMGAELMTNLIKRSKVMNQVMAKISSVSPRR